MKDPQAIFDALNGTMPWGEILHGIKRGTLDSDQLRLLANAIMQVPDVSAANVDLEPLRRLIALMSICFFAKGYWPAYRQGAEGHQSLMALHGNLAMAIIEE